MASLALPLELKKPTANITNLPSGTFNFCGYTLYRGLVDITQHNFGSARGTQIRFGESGKETTYLYLANWSAVSLPMPAPPPGNERGRGRQL